MSAIEDFLTLKGENFDENTGIAIIARAIEEPLRMIAENAASVAGMFLTTECAMAEQKEENPMPMGGMGGMM